MMVPPFTFNTDLIGATCTKASKVEHAILRRKIDRNPKIVHIEVDTHEGATWGQTAR